MVSLTSQVFYLTDPDIIQEYSNVRVKSRDKEEVRLNPLLLAALKSPLVESLSKENDECLIITEFSKEELQSVLEYSLYGRCDNKKILQAFGIVPMTKKEVIVEPVSVFVNEEMEDSPSATPESFDLDIDTEWISEELVKPKVTPILKSTRKKRPLGKLPNEPMKLKEESKPKDSDEKDPEWTPEAKKPKVNLTQKLRPEPQIPPDWQFPKPVEAYKFPPLTIKIPDPEKHDKGKDFKCSKCPKKCATAESVQVHELKFHSEHYNCPHCYKVFALDDVENFKLHFYRHDISNKPSNKCNHCGKFFKAHSKLLKHIKNSGPHHGDECVQCPFKFTTFKEHQDHVDKCHNGLWKFKCGHCANISDTQDDFQDHLWYAHHIRSTSLSEKLKNERKLIHASKQINRSDKPKKPLEKKMCEECGKYVVSLQYHMKISHGTSNIQCAECSKFYKNQHLLQAHMRKVHIKVPCSRCGEMVPKARMYSHMDQKHVDILNRKFKCEHCGKGFIDSIRLSDHVNIHTGEKPHKCKFCNAGFANRANKAAHEKSHLGIKRTTLPQKK